MFKFIFTKSIFIALIFIFSNSLKAHSQNDTIKIQNKSVGLVLSGGGAKGFCHIGVIKALEENHIPIDYICGTSMGAIVAGLYAIGYTPQQMIDLFKTENFLKWALGKDEISYPKYYYKDMDNPSLFSIHFEKELKDKDKDTIKTWRAVLPNSLISNYPMDFAVLDFFVEANKAAKFNFDSLMIPFFCVSADINKKQAIIHRTGDLGSAIRASMAFPMMFSPVSTDSTVLYDGGIYDNFPWKKMLDIHKPDYLIGSKCISGNITIKDDDLVSLVFGMMSQDSDYSIPDSIGIVIKGNYEKFPIFDFTKIEQIVQLGYEETIKVIDKIKESTIKKNAYNQEYINDITEKRLSFKKKFKPIKIYRDVIIEGDLSKRAKSFIGRTARFDTRKDFSLQQFKEAYYRITESGMVRKFYPTYVTDSLKGENDPILLKIYASKGAPFTLSLGGNISSSSLNQICVGLKYLHRGMNPWRISLGGNLGKLYRGTILKFRHDIGVTPLAYYYGDFVAHQFDYFNGNQALLNSNKLPKNVQVKEFYSKIGITTPILFKKNIMIDFSTKIGRTYQSSFLNGITDSHQIPDRGDNFIVSPSISIYQNNQDYIMYPTSGSNSYIIGGYYFMSESFTPSSTTNKMAKIKGLVHHQPFVRAKIDKYFSLGKHFSIGVNADFSYRKHTYLSNYYSSLISTPAYQPISHSKTLLLEDYRAPSFIAGGISPVIFIKRTFYIHSTFSWFAPYKTIIKGDSGWDWNYSEKHPKGGAIANVAIVWQTPIGPLSFSTSYYSKGNHKWYPQLNFGILIFNNKLQEQ